MRSQIRQVIEKLVTIVVLEGIVYSIQRELGIPVKLVGVGEGINDFAFFDAVEFANGLVS